VNWYEYIIQIAWIWVALSVVRWAYPHVERKVVSALRALRRKMQRQRPAKTTDCFGKAVPETLLDDVRYQPRPIDPENPPKVMYYKPKRENAMAFCTNCGDALERGDKVLVFPATEESHPEIICEGCVKKA
jgi:hypothetical protein